MKAPALPGVPLAIVLLLASASFTSAQDKAPDEPPADEEPRGLRLREKEAFDGLTIIAPIRSKKVHLVEMDGTVVHTWETGYAPGAWLYLLDDGHLLRGGRKEEKTRFHGGGIGGILQEIAWDGTVTWEWELANDERMLHHEIDPMPNGNVLVIAWENHSREDAIAHGRDEDQALEEGLWPDVILEIEPVHPKGAKVVWEWRAWDHLVQDRDPKKPGYAALKDRPGCIDINADHRWEKKEKEETPEEKQKRLDLERQMRATGYVGGEEDDPASKPKEPTEKRKDGGLPPGPRKPSGDWLHTNAVGYLPSEDLIVLSSPRLSEVWIIDHSTTTAEAAGSTGGKRGRGGDLLWRWGNPQNYGRGAAADRRLFRQHDPSWIAGDRKSRPRLLVFNNGADRPGTEYSSVDELELPFDSGKGFLREEGMAFGPEAPVWEYKEPEAFYSAFISGAQRLPNGNTLVCEGADGRVFEVTREGKVVWDYWNPHGGEIEPSPQGGKAPPKALFRAVRLPRDHPAFAGRWK